MRVILAYPFEGLEAGRSVNLPNPVARNLIALGRARRAPMLALGELPKNTEDV